MKKSLTALALALALVGTLAACGTDRNPNGAASDNNGTAGNNSGVTSGTNGGGGSTSGTPGTVSRRYGGQSVYNGRAYGDRDYFGDGRYTAGSNGQVYGNDTVSRDLTRGARDIVRDAEDALDDVGRGIGNAARDIAGNYSGTPSWEPDSSAARY